MRSTRRVRERIALWVAVTGAVAAAALSCGSDDAPTTPIGADAAEATTPVVTDDGGAVDASVHHDATTSDAGSRPVTCTDAGACALAIVTSRDESFCVRLEDGTVACWGDNRRGQLGRGVDAGRVDSPSPARVGTLTDVVSIGHSCAAQADGGAWCWGEGPYLQDPDSVTTTTLDPVKLPIPAVTLVDMRVDFDVATGCALTADGPLCWGSNDEGQVTPIEAGADPTIPLAPLVVPIPSGAPVAAIAMGNASFALRTDGTTLSWGANPPLARVSSLVPDSYPLPIMLDGVTSVDVVLGNACATAQGIAYCWGVIETGMNERSTPAPVVTPEPVVRIATTNGRGNTLALQRACAVGISGDVFCWGENQQGQAGDGTTSFAFSPVKVQGLPAPAADVKTSVGTSCALLVDGRVYCWGDDGHGQLGAGKSREPSLVPVEVLLP